MRAHRLWSTALALWFVHGVVRAQEPPGQAVPVYPEIAAHSTPNEISCRQEEPRPSFWRKWKKKKGQGAPREAYAKPLGESLYATGRTMVANGAAARLTLYQFDFVPGTDQLSVRGQQQLMRMVPLLNEHPFPLVIERTQCTPSLDDQRRLVVLNELGRVGTPIPAERVVIGIPTSAGLSGVEAQVEFRRLLQQTFSGGTATGVMGGVTPGSGSGFTPTAGAGAGVGAQP